MMRSLSPVYLNLRDGRDDWKLHRARAAQKRLPRARNRSLSVHLCDTTLRPLLHNSFLRLCSTHWGNMHGLVGHSQVTLHTVIRADVVSLVVRDTASAGGHHR
jgi:hypothetical protein